MSETVLKTTQSHSTYTAGGNIIFTTAGASGDISIQVPPLKGSSGSDPGLVEGQPTDGRRDNNDLPRLKVSVS
jgi:hypothetical protein